MVWKRTSEIWIIDLSISQSCIIEDLKLCLVCLGNIVEIFLIIGIYLLWVSLASLVSQMIPIGCGESELDVTPLLLRNNTLQILELLDIAALPSMFDLSGTNYSLSGYMVFFEESSNVRNIRTEDIGIGSLDFGEAFQRREESAPEHVATILSIADGVEAAILLDFDNVFDGLVFNAWERV